LKKQLISLRNKVLRRRLNSRPILHERKNLFAGLSLALSRRQIQNSVIFTAGGVIIFLVFGILTQVSTGAKSAKQILGATSVGLEYLQSNDLAAASEQFMKIEQSMKDSQEIFVKFAGASPLGDNLKQIITRALELLKSESNLAASLKWDMGTNASSPEFFAKLQESRQTWAAAAGEISSAKNLLEGQPLSLLPDDLQTRANAGLALLSAAESGLNQSVALTDLGLSLLGGEKKTYLLIFQNNNEARATGGFIGTYGLLEVGNGSIKINKIESIYAIDGQLKQLIAAPGPLQRIVTPHLGMRDSNWFADFPDSSRKILQFLEKENGVLAAGIVSFTPDFFEEVLRITGPIEMPEYGEVLTADNFRDRVQYKTSIDYDRQENQPKKFLADFAPRILSRLTSLDDAQQIRLAEIFMGAIAEKHFMMFSLDPALQKAIINYGAGGELKKTAGDFLAIIHSNSGGGKTDQGIEQAVAKVVQIDSLGRQIVNLKITRTHKALNEIYLPRNVDFMRIFVPDGSKLISSSGFDEAPLAQSTRPGAAADADLVFWDSNVRRDQETGMYVGKESGYTVFMNWLELDPGQSKTVGVEYVLPQIGKQYSLLLQKQPGAREFDFSLEVQGLGNAVFSHPETWETNNGSYMIRESVDKDRFYSIFGP